MAGRFGVLRMLLWRGDLHPVGADECNEAAIFPLPIEAEAIEQDQKIAGFASSYTQRG
jgi:hypothetical protein